MDPLALQINKKKDHYHTKLYISPIGQLSSFRRILPISLLEQKKLVHKLDRIEDSAFGMSLRLSPDNSISNFVPGCKNIFVSMRAMDITPEDLLKWDYKKLPVIFETAPKIWAFISTFFGPKYKGQSHYKELEVINQYNQNTYISKKFTKTKKISLNPQALLDIAPLVKEPFETSIPSDIYFYVNFDNAPKLFLYAKEEMVKNRLYDTWRAHNRLQRIESELGRGIDENLFPRA